MGSLLFSLPVLSIVLAALDALFVRWVCPWRAADVRLFFHAYFLWVGLGLVALAPAWATLRAWDRRTLTRGLRGSWSARTWDARPWLVLLGWMTLPIAAHATLDEHTSLVGFAGLTSTRPWLELGAALCAGLALLGALGRFLGGLPGLRTASVGVALAFVVGLLMPGRPDRAAQESGAGRANLLLLVWDTCRSDRLQPYGFERPTSPGLAALAEHALVFEDSLSASSFTFSSHLSLLTGVHPIQHGAHLLDMRFDPARAESLATLLAQQGYRTGAFVGTDVLSGRTGIRAGFEVYDDEVDPAVCETLAWRALHTLQAVAAELVPALRFNGRPHWFQDFQRPGGEVLARAQAWIRRDDPRPWFCFVNLYDVHWPYLPEGPGREELVRPYDGPVDGYLFRSDAWGSGRQLTEADKRHVADLYEGEIHDLDAAVTRFLDALALEHGGTAVLMTADHGEGLGERDTWNHDDVREPQVRVPLILRLPEPRPEGRRVSAPVSGVDVAPTLLALAGIDAPASMEGRSLLGLSSSAERERWIDDRDHVSPEDHRWALYHGPFKLVRFGAGAEPRYELYDLGRDPAGFEDESERHPELFQELIGRMEQRLGSAAATSIGVDADASAAALQALGYIGGE